MIKYQSIRISKLDNPTEEDLVLLVQDDFKNAIEQIKY